MLQNRYDVVIIGAGPAGLIAAIECCRPAKSLLILEKMPKPVLKLRISGKGRCNITNSAKIKEFIAHFGKNGKFLRHAFGKFFNTDLLNYFEDLGICFKLERGGRYFPRNDNALEIVDALLGKVEKLNIPIETHSEVTAITKLPGEEFSLTIRHAAPGPDDVKSRQGSSGDRGEIVSENRFQRRGLLPRFPAGAYHYAAFPFAGPYNDSRRYCRKA